MNTQRIVGWILALAVGAWLAVLVYQRATDPEPTRKKHLEEALVIEAREVLTSYVAPTGELQLVDPLAPDRQVGKVYIWPTDTGWEISGYYRRSEDDLWHPYLMVLDDTGGFASLAVKDTNDRLIALSAQDERFSAVP